MRLPRSSGVLLHPTSLPGPDGIGDLGAEAYRFVDFLAEARQTVWQLLPLGPPGAGDSPYSGASAFAGNPLLISLDRLADDDLGAPGPLGPAGGPVDYAAVATEKLRRLREAYAALPGSPHESALARFQTENAGWLDDYALFTAIKQARGGAAWTDWPRGLAERNPAALARFQAEHADEVRFQAFMQYVFDRQWTELRRYANERRVRIMGDVPIFVAHDSADVWAHRDLYHLDARGLPAAQAGVPPDYFSPTGQLWGNPLYDWAAIERDGYRWWIERFRRIFAQVDMVRIDHFRGFAAYWSVPAGEATAENGRWEPGPGAALFEAIRGALGETPIVAEDLGTITPDVLALRERLGLPGMKVLQFAFGDRPTNPYLPHNYEPNCVVYTGTHDNDTTVGWFQSISEAERHRVREYLGRDGREIAWDLIGLALGSVADTAVVPMQDLLSLGPEARMNVPGRAAGNWTWRFRPDQLTGALADRLSRLSERYNRVGEGEAAE